MEIIMSEDHDPLYVLLRRSVEDDGPEGSVAFGIFKKRAKGNPGKIFFLTEDYSNPLMFVVKEYEQRIAQLETANEFLKRSLDAAGIAPKKQKTQSFPWEKYPEIELRAFQMRFHEKRSAAEIKDYILAHCPEAEDNTTFVNQRFIQGRPNPDFGIEVRQGGEPIDWAELWKIGTLQHADGWIQRVMRYGNGWATFQKEGHVPKDWSNRDPNKFINTKHRKLLRELYHTAGFLPAAKEVEALVEAAGQTGITPDDLNKQGVSTRRVSDLEHQAVIFKHEKRWVHYSFAHLYPSNPNAITAMHKFVQHHGVKVHGSEHREGQRGAAHSVAPAA